MKYSFIRKYIFLIYIQNSVLYKTHIHPLYIHTHYLKKKSVKLCLHKVHMYFYSLNNRFLLLMCKLFFLCPLENRNTGVVFGAILGAILGASLLSLVGYLLCGKRKTDSFSHRRLYDDRNEPGKTTFRTSPVHTGFN